MINHSWITCTTQHTTPPSSTLRIFACLGPIFRVFWCSLYASIFTHANSGEQRSAYRSRLSPGGCSSSPPSPSMMMPGSPGTLLRSLSDIVIQPVTVHRPSSWLCITVCVSLSSYTSQCTWPCWLSHILHFVSAALEAARSQTADKKKEALELPDVPLCSRRYIKRSVAYCRWGRWLS